MTALVARHVDLAAVVAAAGSRVRRPAVGSRSGRQATGARATVAMAAGKAFSFGYAEHAELLRAAGADVAEFDPLVDPLPDGTDAVLLPGGFPEQFAAELSANDVVRRQINELAADRGAGACRMRRADLPGSTSSTGIPCAGCWPDRRGSPRSSRWRIATPSRSPIRSLYSAGQRVVGHEFHRTAVTFTESYQPAWVYRGDDVDAVRDGAVHAGVHASYLHTHPAAAPEAVARFVAHAAAEPARNTPLGLPGDREPLPGRVAAGRQEGRRGRRRHGRAAPVTPADRQRRGRARHLPHRHPRRRGDGRNHPDGAGIPRRRPRRGLVRDRGHRRRAT